MAENAYNSSPEPPEQRLKRSISQLGLPRYGIHSTAVDKTESMLDKVWPHLIGAKWGGGLIPRT